MAETKKRRTDDEILEEVAGQSLLRSYMQNPAGISMPVQGASADVDSPFREGIAAGTAQVKGDFKQFGALLSLMKGDDKTAKRKLESADFLYEQADEISQNFVQFENAFDDVGSFGEYSKLQIGKLVPQILSSVGAGLGSAVVYGLGKQTLKQGTKKYINNKATRIVNKEKAGIPLNKAEKKFLQEGYEGQAYVKLLKDNKTSWDKFAIDADANKLTSKIFGTKVVGGVGLNAQTAFWAGSFGQSEVIGAAQSAQEYRDQGIELTKDEAALAIMYGVPQALLDTASEFVFFRGALKVAAGELKNAATQEGKQQAASVITDILKASAIQAGKSSLIEGATEMGQEGVLITQRLYDPLGGGKYADPTYDKEMIKMRVLESGFVGALAGGARGAGGGVIAKSYDLLANKEGNRSDIETEAARIRKYGSPATEPMVNISAQIDDMFDPDIPRDIVFIPGMSQAALEAMGSTSSTLGVATLDIESLMKKYPSLGTFNSTNQNPGLFIFDENNPTSNSIMKTIQNGQKVTDEYLRDISGFSGTQNPNDNVVIVTRNKEGRVTKAESVGVDEDGNTTLIEKVQAKAEQDYPATKGYTVERMDKTDYKNELANDIELETPTPVQAEFDFVDAEEDPDIIKIKEEEKKLNVKDVKGVTSFKDLKQLNIKTTKEKENIEAFRTQDIKRAAYLAITEENRLVVTDPDTRQRKSRPFKYKGKLQTAEKDGLFLFKGEFSLLEAVAISEALETKANLNLEQPFIGNQKQNGKYDIVFKTRGFSRFAQQAESEGPRYNKDRIAEQSTGYEDSSAAAPDSAFLPSVASLENFDDVKGFLYARNLSQRNASFRPLNASGQAVTRRAAKSWEEGGTKFGPAGFFTPLSNMTPDQKERFTPSLELRRQLQGLLSTEVEGGLVEASKLKKVISGFNVDAEGNSAPDIPSPVYQAIIDAHAANPDVELTVFRTDRNGETISDVAYEARDSKTEVIKRTRKVGEDELGKPIFEEFTIPKQEVVKVSNQEDSFYRVVELLDNDKQETLLNNLKKSFRTAFLIERPLKDKREPNTKANTWNPSVYAESFRIRLDPLLKDPITIKRNKEAINRANDVRVVSMKQLLTGEAKRRLEEKTMGTTGIISANEYQKIITLDDSRLVFDNFMGLLVSLKEGGFVLEYGEGYARKDEGGFDFEQPLTGNERYKPVVEEGDERLKKIVIPNFKSRQAQGLPPELVKTISNKAQTIGDLLPDPTRRPSQYEVRENILQFVKKSPRYKTFIMKDLTVISGGQTGADIIFSQAAKEAGLKTGGTAAQNFRTEDGNRPEYSEEFNMEQDTVGGYTSRTKKNVENSDGTIIVVNDNTVAQDKSYGFIYPNMSPGSRQTQKFAIEALKPYLVVTPNVNAETIARFLVENNIKVLNGAGSRGSTLENQNKLKNTLAQVFRQKDIKLSTTGSKGVQIPNPNIKESKRLLRVLNKLPQLKRSIEVVLERNELESTKKQPDDPGTGTGLIDTIYDLGLENSDIAESDLEFDREKGPNISQKEAIDRSVIRGILGLTSEEDTHADYPFKNKRGGLDFIEALELKLDEDFYELNKNVGVGEDPLANPTKYSPFVTGENETVRFKAPQGSNRQSYQAQSDFEIILEAAIETIQLVDQTLEAQAEVGSQPPVINDNLEVSYTDVVGLAESDTDMFATSSIVQENRKLTKERAVPINVATQAKYGLDDTKLSGRGRADEKADKWRDYRTRKSGKTTFGPKIKEFFKEQISVDGKYIVNKTSAFNGIEALDQSMRKRFKNTRDITVLSVNDKLSTMKLTSSQNLQIAKIRNGMIKNREPAKFIGFAENKDLILLNPYSYPLQKTGDNVALRQTGLYFELAHEFGHSIIEDQIQDLFNFNNKELRKDFMGAFELARKKLEAKGDMKYSDPDVGPQEFLADQIAALALADVSLKPSSDVRKQLGLQNVEGINKYSFDNLLTNRLRAFLRRILIKLKTYIDTIHVQYNNRFKVARDIRGDIDSRFLKSLNRTLSTFRGQDKQELRGKTFTHKMIIMDAATTVFENNKKYINKKQAKKLKNYLARQASKMYNSELGLTRVFGHPAEHWSMKYMFSSAASYLTSKSFDLGKSMYGLTQSEDDFGYKRTYLIIQNQKMSDLLSVLPTDKKGNPDFEVLQEATAIAEDYVKYPAGELDTKNPTQKIALDIRSWLDNFFKDYIQDPGNPNKIKFMQEFFPRLWSMAELRNNSKAREVLAGLLFQANKDRVDTVKNKEGKQVQLPHQVPIEDYKTGRLVDYPAAKRETWDKFVDKWLGTEDDSDVVLLEDDEFNVDQNKKRNNSDIDNLSIGMTKSRADYFVALENGAIRQAESANNVTLLTSPENALRRYVQDTVKKIEYNKQVQTSFTIDDYERMEKMYAKKEDIPFTKPKKRNIAKKGQLPVYIQEYPVFGARAAEVMISRINDPAERQGARKAVEGLLGKSGAGMSPFMRQVNSWGLLLNWFGYLSFAVLASAPDMAGPLFRGKGLIGISDVVKEAVVPWTKDADFAKQFAIDIGVVSHESITSMFIDAAELGYMNETTQKWAGMYFKGIGLDWYTNFTRKFAAGLGEQFIFRLAIAKQTLQTTRWLKELGLTADDVVYWHNQNGDKGRAKRDFSTPQGEKVRMAIAQFVEESILRPGAAERPVWASNPYFALVFQLKSFFYAYGKTIIGGVYREALNSYADNIAQGQRPSSALFGATAPVALGASALLVLTALGLEMRELIKYLANGGDSTKFRSDNMDWGEYMFEMTDRAGVLGPLGILIPIFEAPGYGDSMILEALGPMAGRVDDLLVQGNIALNPEDSFWSFVPIASGLELDWF